ncbi:MAG TPA: PEP/pyruvate-binding domain-containing protein [Acidimicrobiia bacterium]|nr:PEP/pyruvate-binding domain-containing protein [Acidimicrobiia bacterium]
MIDHQYVELLDGTGIDRDEAGGKAWALDRLVEHGFPVPQALVVRSAAYRAFAATPTITAALDDLRASPLPRPAETAAAEARIEKVFLTAPMPPTVEHALRDAVSSMLDGHRIAVRSSATAEDLAGSSFAGQYRTHLDIVTVEQGLDAIRRCWASLWFPAVCAYRRHTGVDEKLLAMAVIVQRLIDADWSGVLFTRDPQGDGSTLRIEAVRGMGEQLVSGQVTPGDHRISRRGLRVASTHDPTPPHLEDLARVGLRIERRFGEPQDIEWSIGDGAIWILQSRPITVAAPLAPFDDGFDTHPRHDDRYTPQGVAEMLPGVLPPLIWSMNRPLLEGAFRTMLARQHARPVTVARPFVARFHGRAVLNLTAIQAAASAGGDAEIENAYLGTDDGTEPDGSRARLGDVRRIWRAQRRIEDDVGVFTTAVACLSAIEPDLSDSPAGRLIAYRHELRDLAARGALAELSASNAAATAYRSLETMLRRWLGPDAGRREAQRITSGSLGRVSVGPRRVAALAAVIDDHATVDLRSELTIAPAAEARRRLIARGPEGISLAEGIETAAADLGCVSVYGGATYLERDDDLWRLAAAAARHRSLPPMESVDSMIDRAIGSAGRRWRASRIVTGQLVDVRRRLLRRLARDAIRFLGMREEAKHALLVLGGFERRVIAEGARRLVRSGNLRSLQEIELLDDTEFDEMLAGTEPVGRGTLNRRATTLERLHGELPLPSSFTGTPEGAVAPAATSDEITGWAASAGIATGRVRQIRSIADGELLEPGEILVAVTTDPSWTPLFMLAGGIVLEQGGPLSHAAIVARELELPAVLNVPDALRRLPTGAEVEVDGTSGVIRPTIDREAVNA